MAQPDLSDSAAAAAESEAALRSLRALHNGVHFLTPADLSRSPPVPARVALIGSCFLECWTLHRRRPDGCTFDLFVTNNLAELPDMPPPGSEAGEYDFQIVQFQLRTIWPDHLLWRIPYDDVGAHQKAFDECVRRMEVQLAQKMKWNTQAGLLSFVANFPLPQKPPLGSLLPRYDLRNPEHFVQRLNEKLEELVRRRPNAYILDIDRICASFGRRYIQDDTLITISHNAAMGLPGAVTGRAESLAPMLHHYDLTWPEFLPGAVWEEVKCLWRTARQIDPVKLVITDLDDTLWRGISGEMEDCGPDMLEGWHAGYVEALMYLKKRGILLAIVSRNEESRILEIWQRVFRNRLPIEAFAARRINWLPKAENVRAILAETNLLPGNAVFIDDNPAERAAVALAFPQMRVLGRYPYYLRRVLLWSSETQPVAISAESAARTEMVQRQAAREAARAQNPRAAFLREAAPTLRLFHMLRTEHPRFPRVLELINKTNQFNTTGERRSHEAMERFFAAGGRVLAYEASDSFTDYGLVGAMLLRGNTIEQWVMSCRVLGYEIEQAVLAAAVQRIRTRHAGEIIGHLVQTDANFPCRDVFRDAGFSADGACWRLPADRTPPTPAHIRFLA